jgi:CheY-like chemotaxis protein
MLRLPFFAAHDSLRGARAIDVSNLPQSPPCRVLAVDDDRDGVETLQVLLEAFGHDVRIAYDGPTAIDIARTFRPEVVLLDLALPRMNGYEVAAQIFDLLGFDNVAIVAMTGYGQETDRQRTRKARFSDHLVKPVGAAELAAVLAARCPTPPALEA